MSQGPPWGASTMEKRGYKAPWGASHAKGASRAPWGLSPARGVPVERRGALPIRKTCLRSAPGRLPCERGASGAPRGAQRRPGSTPLAREANPCALAVLSRTGRIFGGPGGLRLSLSVPVSMLFFFGVYVFFPGVLFCPGAFHSKSIVGQYHSKRVVRNSARHNHGRHNHEVVSNDFLIFAPLAATTIA